MCAPVDALAASGLGLVHLSVAGCRPEARDLFAVYPSRAFVPVRVRAALAWVVALA